MSDMKNVKDFPRLASSPGLFKELTVEEAQEFAQWARDNYKPGDPIPGIWHPVVQRECVIMNEEELGYEEL